MNLKKKLKTMELILRYVQIIYVKKDLMETNLKIKNVKKKLMVEIMKLIDQKVLQKKIENIKILIR